MFPSYLRNEEELPAKTFFQAQNPRYLIEKKLLLYVLSMHDVYILKKRQKDSSFTTHVRNLEEMKQ